MLYFASDFHLGIPNYPESREREARICKWLEMASKDATEIFLLGDVFDFWFEYKHAVPKGYVRLLGTIAKITDSGIKITMFKGNHDMWMFDYLETECGVRIISDELELLDSEKKFFLHHGDGLGPRDKGYDFLRKVFRSGWAQWLFARIHPNTGIVFGKFLSRRSRISQKGRYEKYMGDGTEHLTVFCKENAKEGEYDFMIFGHRHLCLDIQINEKCRYINLGEWVYNSNYAVFDGAALTVHAFKG